MVQGCNSNYITTIIGRRGRCSHMQQHHHHVYNNNSHLHHFGGEWTIFFFCFVTKSPIFQTNQIDYMGIFYERTCIFD